jgi:peptidoglycan pentaglycine glycine transferase (the first glycine)
MTKTIQLIADPDHEAWNRFVASQPGGTLFQSHEWGQLRERGGWRPHYLAVAERSDWKAATLVLEKRLPGIGPVLYSPRGPVIDAGRCDLQAVLTEAVQVLARRVGAAFWRIDPAIPAEGAQVTVDAFRRTGFQWIPDEWSYWNKPKYEMRLAIQDGEDQVLSRLGSKTRTKIRHAPKRGVTVERGSDRDIESFYRLLMNTGTKKRIPIRNLQYFHTLYALLDKSGMGALFLARYEGAPIAAGLTGRFGDVATLLYLSNDYSSQRAGWALQWEMIRWSIAQGCRTYDFGGTGTGYPPNERDKGYGVYQFKRSFGGAIVTWVGYADYVFKPASYRTFRFAEWSLPLGERLLLDWPKALLHRLRSRTRSKEPEQGA